MRIPSITGLCLLPLLFVGLDAGAEPLAPPPGEPPPGEPPPAAYGLALLEALSLQARPGAMPGTWVEFAVTAGGVEVGPYLRMVLAGEEGPGTWIELWISQRPGSGSQAFRILLAPGEAGRPTVQRVQTRTLGGQPTDLPLEDLGGGATAPGGVADAGRPPRDAGGGSRNTTPGRELRTASTRSPVLTGAGTIRAEKVEVWEGRHLVCTLWRSEEVPLFGLVQADFGGVLGLVLHGQGTGSPLLFEELPGGARP
jgi:hypothetical protein